MCLAVAKPKGVELPSWEFLHNMYKNNDDGAGWAIAPGDGQVYIKKGFMTWEAFKASLEALQQTYNVKECGMLLHARITTHGGTIPGLTHPFPIIADENALRKTAYVSPYAVVHNGIITLTSSAARSRHQMSDTAVFIEKYISLIAQNRNWFYCKANIELIEKLADSKIAILNGEGDIIHTSGFTEDNGCLWSNTSYKDGYFRKLGNTSYSSYYHGGYTYGSGYGSSYYGGYTAPTTTTPAKSTTSLYKTFKLMRADVGDTIDADCGSFEVTEKERDSFFLGEPNEIGLFPVYQRYNDNQYLDDDYSCYFSEYEYMGIGMIFNKAAQEREFVGNLTVYADQFIGGLTPDIAIEDAEQYMEEEDAPSDVVDIEAEQAEEEGSVLDTTDYKIEGAVTESSETSKEEITPILDETGTEVGSVTQLVPVTTTTSLV